MAASGRAVGLWERIERTPFSGLPLMHCRCGAAMSEVRVGQPKGARAGERDRVWVCMRCGAIRACSRKPICCERHALMWAQLVRIALGLWG